MKKLYPNKNDILAVLLVAGVGFIGGMCGGLILWEKKQRIGGTLPEEYQCTQYTRKESGK